MIKQFTRVSMVSAAILAGAFDVLAGWQDYLPKDASGLVGQLETPSVASRLTESEVAAGLKEALTQGVETAIKTF